MKFDILTIFPHILDSYFSESMLKRGQDKKLITIKTHDIRSSATSKHKNVDDTPYGGGVGMVLKVDVVHQALKKIYKKKNAKTRVILLTPRGRTYDQIQAKRLSKYPRLILITGHYEAIDARIDHFVDEKISLGNFILTGGELAAAVIVDSVSRLISGVVGKEQSVKDESFSVMSNGQTNIEYPQYTRPVKYLKYKVPEVLLSGNHKKINDWRNKHRQLKTYK